MNLLDKHFEMIWETLVLLFIYVVGAIFLAMYGDHMQLGMWLTGGVAVGLSCEPSRHQTNGAIPSRLNSNVHHNPKEISMRSLSRIAALICLLVLSSCALKGQSLKSTFDRAAINAVSTVLIGEPLTEIPRDRIQGELKRFALAFGRQDLVYFPDLPMADQAKWFAKAPVLMTTHTDWVDPLKWVPRTWTTWVPVSSSLAMPRLGDVLGDSLVTTASILPDGTLRPIPACGDHYVVRGYIASTWKLPTSEKCIHTRIGMRHDDVDGYYSLDITIKEMDQHQQ